MKEDVKHNTTQNSSPIKGNKLFTSNMKKYSEPFSVSIKDSPSPESSPKLKEYSEPFSVSIKDSPSHELSPKLKKYSEPFSVSIKDSPSHELSPKLKTYSEPFSVSIKDSSSLKDQISNTQKQTTKKTNLTSKTSDEESEYKVNLYKLLGEHILIDNNIWVRSHTHKFFIPILNNYELRKYLLEKFYQITGINNNSIFNIISEKQVNSLFKNLKVDFRNERNINTFNSVDNLLPLENEIIKVENGNIEIISYEESKEIFKTSLDGTIMPTYKKSTMQQFIHDFLGGNDENSKKRFWELMGNLLFTNQEPKVICCLYGKGNDGKSTLIKFLQNLFLTPTAVCSTDMRNAFSNHGAASFENANIVVLQECNEVIKQSHADVIKRLTGGDGIMVNPKHRNMHPKIIKVKLLLACNHQLRFAPGVIDEALKNRFEFIQVYSVPQNQRNPNLLNELLTEKDYFIKKAIEGFARLQKNNYKFTCSNKDSELKELIFSDDPAQNFIDTCCEISSNGSLTAKEFKEAFIKWSKTYPDKCTQRDLKNSLINKGFHYKRIRINGSQPYCFEGLKLKLKFGILEQES